MSGAPQRQQKLDGAQGILTAIEIISQKDQGILGAWSNLLEQAREQGDLTMQVGDGVRRRSSPGVVGVGILWAGPADNYLDPDPQGRIFTASYA